MARPDGVLKTVGFIFGGVGVLLATVCVWLLTDAWNFNESAKRAEGIVTRIERIEHHVNERSPTNYAFVQFHDGDRLVEFRSKTGSSSARYSVGEKVTVLYQPGKGEQARIDSLLEQYLLPGIFGLLGVIFVLVACLVFILPALGKRRRRLALTTGISVNAKVTEVRITSFQVNGRHPWIIVAEHQDENLGQKFTFTSENLWTDPTSYYPVSSTVTVFYLPENPSIHAFVLDKIPEMT